MCLWLLVGLAPAWLDAHAQRVEAPEATVKAAFLFKFAGYVEWPPAAFASPEAPFVFGILGGDEVATELTRLAPARTISGHPVVVKRLKEGEPLRGIHVIFIGRAAADRQALTGRASQMQAMLVVTEAQFGLEAGSSINFVMADERVGFEVSLDAAEKSGLRISSRMLSVARRVVQKGG
jgi:hypothetical protein